jgi:large repetitive protein
MLTVEGVTISGGSTNGVGGGISNAGTLTVSNSTLSGNTASSSGGGIMNFGMLTVTNSTISGNSANGYGNGGGGIFNAGILTVTNSTLSGNFAEGSSDSAGGGIYNSGTLTITNSTLSGNSARLDGRGIRNSGTLTVTNSTLVGNRADVDGDGDFSGAFGAGGGIWTSNSASTTLFNTIVAGNLVGTGTDPNDLAEKNVEAISVFNLIGNAGSAGGLLDRKADPTKGNIIGVDGVGTRDIATILDINLVDNGGPTLTHALIAGGAAIDAGDPDFDPNAFVPPLVTDQRGLPRVAGGRINMGAVEHQVIASGFTVNTMDDTVDANPGDGSAADANGNISLRAAIMEANAISGGRITIVLPAGDYFLTIAGANEDGGATGDLDVRNHGSIIIKGAGAGETVINAGGDGGLIPALGDRVFHVFRDASLTVEGVTITGGIAGGFSGAGGGIRNEDGGMLTIVDSTLSGNSATSLGGGILNDGGLTVTGSTFSGNSANFGGGLYARGIVTVTGSTFSGNLAGSLGGGIAVVGRVTVTDSTLSGNSADEGGGIWNNNGDLTLTGSTLSGNSAGGDSNAGRGGGIQNSGSLSIVNSTLSGNSGERDGGGIFNTRSLSVRNSTLVGNRADADGEDGGTGGGIATGGISAFTELVNTIVAGNFAGAGTTANDLANKDVETGSSFNLIGDANSAGGLTDGSNGNIVGVDVATVLELTLADNGGPTLTHALVAGGPAVDAGDPNFDAGVFNPPLVHDQRGEGFDRVAGGRIDIGAVELPASEPAGPLVTGQVWLDADANGLLDSGEAGVANIAVRLRDASSRELLDETVTDDQGDFVLEAGDAEEVFVEFVAPERHIYTRRAEPGSDGHGSHAARGSGVSVTDIFPIGGGFGDSSSPVRAGLVPLRESAPWQNPVEAEDVDNNGSLSIQDLLALVTQLREQGPGDFEGEPETLHEFVDVNGDNQRTISDLLAVVTALRNALSGGGFGGEGEAELHGAHDPVDAIAAANAGFWPAPDLHDRALRDWSNIDSKRKG